MQPPSKSKIWSNEDLIKNTGFNPILNNHLNDALNDGEYEPVTKKPKKILQARKISHPIDEKSNESMGIMPPVDHIDINKVQTIDPSPLPSSDEDWLRSRTSRLLDLPGSDELLDSATIKSKNDKTETKKPAIHIESAEKAMSDAGVQTDDTHFRGDLAPPDIPSDPAKDAEITFRRLFVRNLPYTATGKDLREYLESQGQHLIEEVSLSVSFDSRALVFQSNDEYPDRDILCFVNDVSRKSVLVDASFSEDGILHDATLFVFSAGYSKLIMSRYTFPRITGRETAKALPTFSIVIH